MVSQVTNFVSGRWGVPTEHLRVEVQPLHGGLESEVSRARIVQREGHRAIPPQLVIKHLPVGFEREADVYELLWRYIDRPPAVRLLGREIAAGTTYLYLEDAQPLASWPWADAQRAGAVCRALARLHDDATLPHEAFSWNYETGLVCSAQSTLEHAADACDECGQRLWQRIGDLRRVVTALARIRHRLLSGATTVIHGDMHPGNVILRGADPEVVLIDWARARVGSPLEDVASWLHSLGCWEPEARRRHDTLMRIYLDARRNGGLFASDVREDYCFASASNGLSGAIRYHLAVLSDRGSTDAARYDSRRALIAWQRVIRRAAAFLSTNPDRCS